VSRQSLIRSQHQQLLHDAFLADDH
jgi:hypothetical protein